MIDLIQDMLGIPRGRRAQREWRRRYIRSLVSLIIGAALGIAMIFAGVLTLFSIRWTHSWGWIAVEITLGLLLPSIGLALVIAAFLLHEHRTAAQLLPPLPHLENDKIRCPGCKKKVLLAPFCKKCGRSLRDCV